MPRKQSKEMDAAKKLVLLGLCNASEAALQVGLTVTAIYNSKWYAVFKQEKKKLKGE